MLTADETRLGGLFHPGSCLEDIYEMEVAGFPPQKLKLKIEMSSRHP